MSDKNKVIPIEQVEMEAEIKKLKKAVTTAMDENRATMLLLSKVNRLVFKYQKSDNSSKELVETVKINVAGYNNKRDGAGYHMQEIAEGLVKYLNDRRK